MNTPEDDQDRAEHYSRVAALKLTDFFASADPVRRFYEEAIKDHIDRLHSTSNLMAECVELSAQHHYFHWDPPLVERMVATIDAYYMTVAIPALKQLNTIYLDTRHPSHSAEADKLVVDVASTIAFIEKTQQMQQQMLSQSVQKYGEQMAAWQASKTPSGEGSAGSATSGAGAMSEPRGGAPAGQDGASTGPTMPPTGSLP